MKPIVLATINARWAHTALGLRSLVANLGRLRPRARLLEFRTGELSTNIAEKILALDPAVVGLGVYIWNLAECSQVVALLKRLRPGLPVILGGPEVSCEQDLPALAGLADHIIAGEGELAFRELCERAPKTCRPGKFLVAEVPDLATLELPYELYDDQDIAHRTIYVEASRGCPFGCEFCLANRTRVRRVPPEKLLAALDRLWQRGARQFKFVDRALHLALSRELLEFFRTRCEPGTFVHLELVPDHLPRHLAEVIADFPSGVLQLEAGVQTFNPEVSARIGRQQDYERLGETLGFLRHQTGVHLHADLIVGLPGETMASFAAGFDRLIALAPHEIQIGLLKRLRGTPIKRHDREWAMVYSPEPPYEVLRTGAIDFPTMQRLRRFARYFDLVFNSGNFPTTAPLLWSAGSPFLGFLGLSDWLWSTTGSTSGIALNRLARLLYTYLSQRAGIPAQRTAAAIHGDYQRLGRKPIPLPLAPSETQSRRGSLPPRQRRHQGS